MGDVAVGALGHGNYLRDQCVVNVDTANTIRMTNRSMTDGMVHFGHGMVHFEGIHSVRRKMEAAEKMTMPILEIFSFAEPTAPPYCLASLDNLFLSSLEWVSDDAAIRFFDLRFDQILD